MIKAGVDDLTKPKYILSGSTKLQGALSFQGTGQFIPIDINARLVTNSSSSVHDLGRELLKSAAEGDVSEVKSLLTKGAPFLSDWLGTTPLHLAVQSNSVEICEILLRAGISKDAKNKVDRSPLHMAAYEGHLKVVETLIKHQAEVDCLDMLNMTPLHWAVQNGHIKVAECLVKNGATIEVTNKFNLTPTDIAVQMNRQDIVDLLQAQTARLNTLQEAVDISSIDLRRADENVELFGHTESTTRNEAPNENGITYSHILNENQTQMSFLKNEILNDISDDMEDIQSDEENESPLSAVKSLQKQMIQNDKEETSILNSIMESGHSVVLTEAGKEILKSVKESEENSAQKKGKNIITVTPEQFLAMMKANSDRKMSKIKVISGKPPVKRIVMSKNKLMPVVNAAKAVSSEKHDTNLRYTKQDLELVTSQLVEAKKLIEEYKVKLHKKEQEAERYKHQLKILMDIN